MASRGVVRLAKKEEKPLAAWENVEGSSRVKEKDKSKDKERRRRRGGGGGGGG